MIEGNKAAYGGLHCYPMLIWMPIDVCLKICNDHPKNNLSICQIANRYSFQIQVFGKGFTDGKTYRNIILAVFPIEFYDRGELQEYTFAKYFIDDGLKEHEVHILSV
ncbi:MAG: hypothetical protein ACREOO_25905 [bacterium]